MTPLCRAQAVGGRKSGEIAIHAGWKDGNQKSVTAGKSKEVATSQKAIGA